MSNPCGVSQEGWAVAMNKFGSGGIVLALAALLALAPAAHAVDISLLTDLTAIQSDFASPAIPNTEALVIQGGNLNSASIDQSGGSAGAGNYSEIDQSGSNNTASVGQSGDSNSSRIVQSGSDNYASVTQIGSGNLVDLAQSGDAYLTATQIGNYNAITGSQTNQNGVPATLSEIGNNNTINLISNTPGISVNIGITGNGMTVNRVY
jgi:hypothetical protein